MGKILVTGGAGYIGSVIVEVLVRSGREVVVLDNLCEGHGKAVSPQATLIEGDLADRTLFKSIFRRFEIESVVHMAALCLVGASMEDPGGYFQNNVLDAMNLLNAMVDCGVKKIVFSSTAAVYGEPEETPISEDHPTKPVNPYGESKLMFETILRWYHRAHGLNYATLRYFNAAGASENCGEHHDPETHLIPRVLDVALHEDEPGWDETWVTIYGTDYETRDGSCIRDYIHVLDLAQAHVLALHRLNNLGERAYNLGNSEGHSVLQVIDTAKRVTGKVIPTRVGGRRPGDPAVLVASSDRIKEELGWKPRYPDLESIVTSAWDWLKRHPKKYEL